MGDFSHREARERVRANEKRLAEWRKQKTSSKNKGKTPKK
jgi:hypothetical protein